MSEPLEPPPMDAREALLKIVNGYMLSQCVYVAAKLGVADFLRQGPKTPAELAAATGVHSESLFRVLRTLASAGIFSESELGQFELTPMAQFLCRDTPGSARGWTIMRGEEFLWQPWGNILHAVKTGQSAFPDVFKMDWPEYFSQNPGASEIFDDAMRSISAQKYAAAATAYDFSGIGTIADIGGGNGGLITAILEANPAMRGILADLPHVIDGARHHIDAAGLTSRCDCVSIDMFEDVPKGADAYIMANVIHDWDDARSITILRNCRQALQPDGRMLLVEMVLSGRNEPHLSKLVDIEMLVMTDGGKERSENEFRELYEASDLQLTNVVPTDSPWSVIEGVAS